MIFIPVRQLLNRDFSVEKQADFCHKACLSLDKK